MNTYKHNIDYFNRETRDLSLIERSIYRELIELYYITDKMLPRDIGTLVGGMFDEARSSEYSNPLFLLLIDKVLKQFFTPTPDGWYHSECEGQLNNYRCDAMQ